MSKGAIAGKVAGVQLNAQAGLNLVIQVSLD